MQKTNWKAYQDQLKKDTARALIFKGARLIGGLCLLILVFSGISNVTTDMPKKAVVNKTKLERSVLKSLLKNHFLANQSNDHFTATLSGVDLYVQTSIEPELQQMLLKMAAQSPYTPYIGIVAMKPSGAVLAMVSRNDLKPERNICLTSDFPAASIFKIITAAAGLEQNGLTPDSYMTYTGGPYTLYKYQLKNKARGNRITLKNAFAKSINPVFGKIGMHFLKKEGLLTYAEAFGFNQPIDFEKNVLPSHISLSDDSYQWAEIASGFNRQTTISPLHGAIIAATVLNQGIIPRPTLVEQVLNTDGEIVYRKKKTTIQRAMRADTAKKIYTLMRATVQKGTAKKAFRGYNRDRVLKKINMGGKTGSINSRVHAHQRYDWFIGFGETKGAELVISVVVVHEKYLDRRAAQYARAAFKHYFR